MTMQRQSNDKHCRKVEQHLDKVYNEGNKAPPIRYYQVALDIARQLFVEFKDSQPLPDALTSILVASYLNLAESWGAQNKEKEQILCLIEIYNLLSVILNDHSITQSLSSQAFDGINKIFAELCICFKKMDAQQELARMEEGFAELSLQYQSQLYALH